MAETATDSAAVSWRRPRSQPPRFERAAAWCQAIVTALVVITALVLAGCAGSAHAGNAKGTAASCTQHRAAGGYTVTLSTGTCPAPAGSTTTVTIAVRNKAGQAVAGTVVTLRSVMPSMGMSGDQITALPHGSGYQASILLGMSGNWLLDVTVVPPGARPSNLQFTVPAS